MMDSRKTAIMASTRPKPGRLFTAAAAAAAVMKVIVRAYKLMVLPIVKCEVEYPTRKGPKVFKIWAIGNPKGWMLDAKETPTELTARIAALHATFALTILIEFAIEAGIYLGYIKI